TPLAKFAEGDPNDFRRSVLTKIRQGGFQTILADWLADLDLPEKSFAKDRAEELLKAAAEFDAASQGRAGLDEFVSFARGFVSSENPADNTIRVLTVHAAKGLDFDMVVLPDIDSHGFSSRRDPSLHLHHDSNGEVKWALELPPEKICAVDPVLREAWQAESAKDCYENVCLSYVAVTRARRGLYILSRRLEPKSTSKDFNRLLHGTFPRTGIALGNYAWHIEFGQDRGVSEAPTVPVLSGPRLPDLGSVRPSKTSTSPIFAASFFSEADTFAVGSEVHRTLAQISWFDEGLPDFKHLSPAAEGLIASFLQTNIAERLFTRPTGACSVWREKAFDALLDGQWISGVFDRVVIHQAENGRSSRAEIYDFKSDVDLDPEIYRRQMSLYRKCLCSLLALSETSITCHLIAIRTGEEVTLASPARLEQMTLFA
ncbi:MAG TPA: 3'-5' exonuclease, partial [Terrimicrobiaceae bacterium]